MKPFNLKYADHRHSPDGRRLFNQHLFAVVAPQYDRVTRRLSLGRDQAWKTTMIRGLPPSVNGLCLDVACGTGDLTGRLVARYPGAQVIGIDLTVSMLDLARRSIKDAAFEQGDMINLRFASGSVDILTGGYALRNAPDIDAALDEWRRVLKPHGTLALLDFSKPANRFGASIQLTLLNAWGSFWGWRLHRNPDIYKYLADSLATYPNRQQIHRRLRERGFRITRTRHCFFGMLQWIIATKMI